MVAGWLTNRVGEALWDDAARRGARVVVNGENFIVDLLTGANGDAIVLKSYWPTQDRPWLERVKRVIKRWVNEW